MLKTKCIIFPLDLLLSAICRSPRVRGLLQQQLPSSGTDGIIRHIADGELMKMHPLFKEHPDALILHLYVDAYETTNPLGSHTGIHKIEALHDHTKLSQLSSIQYNTNLYACHMECLRCKTLQLWISP
jgi:hypothetical protein